jgi:hypothetical protein
MTPDAPEWAGLPFTGLSDTSSDPTSPIAAPSSPRNRALRDFVSVLDYGTYTGGDMTAVFQAALNDASAKGSANGAKFKLYVPPLAYQMTSVTPVSYVDIHAHGASLTRPSSYVTNHSFFYGGAGITQFALRGFVINGTNTELPFQGLCLLGNASFLTIEDCWAQNVAATIVYISDAQHVRVKGNTMQNVTQAGGANPINLKNGANGNTSPLQHLWIEDNYIDGCPTIPIDLVSDQTANRTDPVVDAHITGNTCVCTGAGWPIAVEQGGSAAPPNLQEIDISGNLAIQKGTGTYGICLTNDSAPASNDPLCISGVTLAHNRVISQQAGGIGILCSASHAAITGNRIAATTDDIRLTGHGTAVIHHITESGNVGHMGTGQQVAILNAGSVDTTTLSSSNTP